MLSWGCSWGPELESGVVPPCSAPQRPQRPRSQPPPAIRHAGVPGLVLCMSRFGLRAQVPEGFTAVMSATSWEKHEDNTFVFKMSQPIPSYLIALAVGDIVSADVGPRWVAPEESRVLSPGWGSHTAKLPCGGSCCGSAPRGSGGQVATGTLASPAPVVHVLLRHQATGAAG